MPRPDPETRALIELSKPAVIRALRRAAMLAIAALLIFALLAGDLLAGLMFAGLVMTMMTVTILMDAWKWIGRMKRLEMDEDG